MSSVLKGEEAVKVAFVYKPKPFQFEASAIAQDFVEREKDNSSGFQVSKIVSEAAGIEELRRKNMEAAVEETVLQRMKDIEEQAYCQAYDLGLIEGEKKAFEEKSAEFRQRIEELDQLLTYLDSMKLQMLQQNEVHFLHLLTRMAAKIALHDVEVNQEPLAQYLKQVVESLAEDDRVNVHVSKADYDYLEDLWKRLGKQAPSLDRIKLIPESDITPGGALIETNFGAIDATIEQRVKKVWDEINSKTPILRGQKVDLPLPEKKESDPSQDGGDKN